MTDERREAIRAAIAKALEQTKIMSPEQAKKLLVEEGLYDERGRLTARYGGRVTIRG